MTLTFILVFVLFALLLALALVYSKWPNWLKGLLAVAVTGFYFWGYRFYDHSCFPPWS